MVYVINLWKEYENLALDYPNSAYAKALEEGKDRYLVFEGKLTKPNQTEIPYGRKFGGNHETPPPCTLNGFIACRSDEILPEYKITNARYPEDGATISVIENGIKREALIFNEREGKFIPFPNTK